MNMEFSFATPALLFSAISLILLAFTNRFHALAILLRDIHAAWTANHDPVLAAQMANLMKRIRIIQGMQILGVGSFLSGVLSMVLLFFSKILAAELAFAAGLALLALSLAFSIRELAISVKALDILMADAEGRRGK